MPITLLDFVSNFEDIEKIAFDKNLSLKTRNVFKNLLLKHYVYNKKLIKKVLFSDDSSIQIKSRALSLILEENDNKTLQKDLEEIISRLEKDDYVCEKAKIFLEKMLSKI